MKKSRNVNSFRGMGRLLSLLTAAGQFGGALGLTISICSNQNTGSSGSPDTTIYQSLGNCQTKCAAKYAFAIVQGDDCWCSNFAPGNQVDTSQCSEACPGYPYETCGSVSNNLFGYLALNLAPSGTINAQGSTTTPTSTLTTPFTTQQLTTIGGTVMTSFITIEPTTAATSAADEGVTKQKMSSGSVIAIAIASVVAAVVLLAALIIGFCCWRRKVERSYTPEAPLEYPKRTTSVLSKAGLLRTTTNTNEAEGSDRTLSVTERRGSKPLVFDQRLNPNAIMQHDDWSRSSFVSMQDNRDYTRTLNVRNPDPAN